jgi:hypothetical protein
MAVEIEITESNKHLRTRHQNKIYVVNFSNQRHKWKTEIKQSHILTASDRGVCPTIILSY